MRTLAIVAMLTVLALAAAFAGARSVQPLDGAVTVRHVDGVRLVDDGGAPLVVGPSPHGAIVVLGYTRCTDECPLALRRVALALGTLPQDDRPQALFVTVDPGHDDPATLHAYLRTWQNAIVGITGKRDALRRVYAALGAGDPGSRYRDHDTRLFVLNAAGDVVEELSPAAGADEIHRSLVRIQE